MKNKPLVAITGASAGIGKAVAFIFASNGYPVLLMARRKEILDSYVEIKEKVTAKVDVTNFDELQAAIKLGEAKYGPVDLMINNAGVMPLGDYVAQPRREKYQTLDVNIKGVINGMDVVLPTMIKNHHGTIINISSIAGRYSSLNHSVYNGSKAAINLLTEEVRKENAKNNIRFTLVEPGLVKTELSKTTTISEAMKIYQDQINTLNGGLDPKMVAEIILKIYELPQEVNIKEVMLTLTAQMI